MTANQVLKGVDIVVLEFHSTTGRRKLRENDIEIGVGGRLPSEQVASLGAKKVIDPDALKPFQTLKKQAERTLEQHAIKMFGGFAVPRDKTPTIAAELDRIKAEYNGYRDHDFLPNYGRRIEEWINANPDFERQLRDAIYTAEQVRGRIWSSYSIFRVEAAENAGDFAETVKSMGDKLLEEIAAEADKIYERSIQGRDESVSQRIKSPLKRIRAKLAGLAFLEEDSVDPMIEAIDKVLAGLPDNGAITGLDYHRVVQLVLILSNPDKVRMHGLGAIDVQAEAEAALGFVTLDRSTSVSLATPPNPPSEPAQLALLARPEPGSAAAPTVGTPEVVSPAVGAAQTSRPPSDETAINCVVCNAIVPEGDEVEDFYCSEECAALDPQYQEDAGEPGVDTAIVAPMPASVPEREGTPAEGSRDAVDPDEEVEDDLPSAPQPQLRRPGEIETSFYF